MTNQEIFDKVAEHLLVQNEQAYDETSQKCCYRDDHGRKCAVGCLIPDSLYSSIVEGTPVKEVLPAWPDMLPGCDWSACGFLGVLQRIHDCEPPVYWPDSLRAAARAWNLDDSIVQRTIEREGRA